MTRTLPRLIRSSLAIALAVGGLSVGAGPTAPVVGAATTAAVIPLVPGRLLDTRPGERTIDGRQAGTGRIPAGGILEVQITGRHGIPDNATAAMLNVTAAFPDGPGYLTVYPCGNTPPATSSVNFSSAGVVVPNAVLSKIGTNGKICIYTLTATDIITDVTAYVPSGGGVSTVVPGRLLDTRPGERTIDGRQAGTGRIPAGGILEVQITGRHGIPDNATAAMLNVTAAFPDGPGYLTVYPCGNTPPATSSVNFSSAGVVVPNAVLSKIGTNGKICIYTLTATDIITDVTAYVPSGGGVSTVVPGRLLDTRPGERTIDGRQAGTGRIPAGGILEVQITGRHGIPDNATAAMLNVTAAFPDGPGYLTVYPCGNTPPATSSVNFSSAGVVVPNAVLSKIGTNGKICIYTLTATDIITDVTAYVPGSSGPGDPGDPDDPGDPGDPDGSHAATFIKADFAEQQVTIDDDGVAHMVWVDNYGERASYARCASNCSDIDSWTSTELLTIDSWYTSSAGSSGIGVDATGRIHVLFDGWSYDDEGFQMRYATCATKCTSAGSWTFTDLDGLEFGTTADTTRTLMVQPDGHVSFVAAGFNDNVDWTVKYLECTGSCGSVSNWSMSEAFIGYPVTARRDSAGVTHVTYQPSSLDRDQLGYARCVSACSNSANWQVSSNVFEIFAGASLAVTDSGRVFIGYLQAELGDRHDRRYLVNSCAGAGCADLTTWSTFAIGDDWEGWDGAWLETSGEEVLLLTTASEELRGRWCGSACHLPTSFGATSVIDSNAAVGAVVNPMLHAETDLCDSAEPNWWTQFPVAAMTDDQLLVVHRPYATYVCYPDNVIYPLASLGRVVADF